MRRGIYIRAFFRASRSVYMARSPKLMNVVGWATKLVKPLATVTKIPLT